MSNISHIKGAGGAMRNVRKIAGCAGACHQGRETCLTPTKCVIDTDNTAPAQALRFFARLAGWMRGKP